MLLVRSQKKISFDRCDKAEFFEGIKYAKAGNHLYDISKAIQNYAEANGFSIVRDLVGHGIGRNLHEEPQVPNFKPIGRGIKLRRHDACNRTDGKCR